MEEPAAAAAAATPAEEQPSPSATEDLGPRPGLKVSLELETILEHCKCSICMGIIKNTRAVSACMHRFCKECIEAWLRTQIENNCPQCRVKFASKRDCKPDPNFDLLLGAMFGDIQEFEAQMLDPSAEVLQRAMAIGHRIAQARDQAAWRRPSPPPPAVHPPRQLPQHPAAPQPLRPAQQHQAADATVHLVSRPVGKPQQPQPAALPAAASPAAAAAPHVPRPPAPWGSASKRPLAGAPNSDSKRQKVASPADEQDPGLQYRGVRFQGEHWQARTKRAGKELSLGLFQSAEEAGMAYDLDRLQQQGGKAQRLNFPLLRQHYKQILIEKAEEWRACSPGDGVVDFLAMAVQAAVEAARNVPGSTAPENSGPAAASMLNPRRAMPPAVHHTAAAAAAAAAATHAAVMKARQAAAGGQRQAAVGAQRRAAAASSASEDDTDSDYAEEAEQEEEDYAAYRAEAAAQRREQEAAAAAAAAAVDQHAVARQRAEQLAVERPLAAGLAGGVAHVRLEAGSGPTWRMSHLACPVDATVKQLAEAVALGVSQQHRLRPGQLAVGLAVANDLDASADFDALCYEDSVTGNLLLRSRVTIRNLLDTLEDPNEDLLLEYHAAAPSSSTDSGDVAAAAAANIAPAGPALAAVVAAA